jgi:hypothetical protein
MMSVALTGLRRSASGNHLSVTGEISTEGGCSGFHGNGLSDDGLRGQTEDIRIVRVILH